MESHAQVVFQISKHGLLWHGKRHQRIWSKRCHCSHMPRTDSISWLPQPHSWLISSYVGMSLMLSYLLHPTSANIHLHKPTPRNRPPLLSDNGTALHSRFHVGLIDLWWIVSHKYQKLSGVSKAVLQHSHVTRCENFLKLVQVWNSRPPM